MNNDIRLSVGFWQHPKTKKTIKRLGLEGIRSLQMLWIWAAMNKPDGILTGMDAEDVELAADWNGEEGKFISHCIGMWVDEYDGIYSLHDWKEHNAWQAGAKERSRKAALSARIRWGTQENDYETTATRSQRLSEARKLGTHTENEWDSMVNLFKNTCVRCGNHAEKPFKDHITPICKGGSDGIQNIQPVCKSCNYRKNNDNKDLRISFAEKNGITLPNKWAKNECKNTKKDSECLHNECEMTSPILSSPILNNIRNTKPPYPLLGGDCVFEINTNSHMHSQEKKEENSQQSEKQKKEDYSEGFQLFWKEYPKRVGKDAAYKLWKRVAKDSETRKAIMAAIRAQVDAGQFSGRNGEDYTPNPTTWLNQGRWKDEIKNTQIGHSKQSNTSLDETMIRVLQTRQQQREGRNEQ